MSAAVNYAASARNLIDVGRYDGAQVAATLALVEEQRTANLIALLATGHVGTDVERRLVADVKARLDLIESPDFDEPIPYVPTTPGGAS